MIKIDQEFKDLIPSLSTEEFTQLEKNILEEGIRDKLVIWNETLIDGHNRYSIATKHNLPYETVAKEFNNKEEAINWIIDNQLGRRNITLQQRDYLLGLRYRAEKKKESFKGNQYTKKSASPQNDDNQNKRTSEKLAEQHGVSKATVERAEKFATGLDNISKKIPEFKQEVLQGKSEFTKQEISRFADVKEEEFEEKFEEVKKKKVHVSNNSGNDEWYTPPEFTEIAKKIMGNIDLDVASCEIANQFVKADEYYTEEQNALTKDWKGRIWMNPPYSQPLIANFIEKLISEIKKGNVEKACVLVNNATETRWMQMLLKHCDYVWFPSGRIKFIDYKGVPAKTPLQGQAFLIFNTEPKGELEGVVLKNEKRHSSYGQVKATSNF